MLKRINDILADVPATVVAGLFLLLNLVPHLTEEFGGSAVSLNFLPFDPAWVTVIISGIPMVYLALWRVIHNPGISKISSALLIVIAMFAAIAIGDLFAAGEVAWIMVIGAIFWYGSNLTANTTQLTCSPDKNRPAYIAVFCCITAFSAQRSVLWQAADFLNSGTAGACSRERSTGIRSCSSSPASCASAAFSCSPRALKRTVNLLRATS